MILSELRAAAVAAYDEGWSKNEAEAKAVRVGELKARLVELGLPEIEVSEDFVDLGDGFRLAAIGGTYFNREVVLTRPCAQEGCTLFEMSGDINSIEYLGAALKGKAWRMHFHNADKKSGPPDPGLVLLDALGNFVEAVTPREG